jgi:hypothetical protein
MNDIYGMMVCIKIFNMFLFLQKFFIIIDFQSGTIIEQLNQDTHVYQYTLNSMVKKYSEFLFQNFCYF